MSEDGDIMAMLFGLWGMGDDEDDLGVLSGGRRSRPQRLTRRQRRAARRARRRGEQPPPTTHEIPFEIEIRFVDDDG